MKKIYFSYKEPEKIRDMVEEVVKCAIDNAPETEMTEEEKAFIRKIAYSALVTLNKSEYFQEDDGVLAISVMAETLFNKEFPDNPVRSYNRIYKPLCAVIDSWVKESKQKTFEKKD